MRSWMNVASAIVWLSVTGAELQAMPLVNLNNVPYPLIRADYGDYTDYPGPFQADIGTPAGTGLFSYHVDSNYYTDFLTYSASPDDPTHGWHPTPGSFRLYADIYPDGTPYLDNGPSDNFIRV